MIKFYMLHRRQILVWNLLSFEVVAIFHSTSGGFNYAAYVKYVDEC